MNENDDDNTEEFSNFDLDFAKEYQLDNKVNSFNSVIKKRFKIDIFDLNNQVNYLLNDIKYKTKDEIKLINNRIIAIKEFILKRKIDPKIDSLLELKIKESNKVMEENKDFDTKGLMEKKLFDFMKENNLNFKINSN